MLCLVHCIATPFIFITQACTASCCAESPIWWQSIDYVFKGHKRFDSIFIAGDPEQREHNLSKAKYLLDWEPKNHHRDLV